MKEHSGKSIEPLLPQPLNDGDILHETEVLFEALIESATDYAIFSMNPDRLVLTWNKGAERILGYREQDIIGRSGDVIFTPEERVSKAPEREAEKAFAEGRCEDDRWHVRKDGTRFFATGVMMPLQSGNGKAAGFVKILRDRTKQKRSEVALTESRERLRSLIASIHDYAIFTLDREGRVTSWNEGARRIKGYAAEEIIGKSLPVFYTPEDVAAGKPYLEMKTALETGRSEDESWRVRKDGSLFWANEIMTPLVNADGELFGFTKITRDLTERRSAEEALRKNEQLLRHLTKNIPGGSLNVFDRELRYLYAEGQGLSDAGLTSEQLVGKTLSDLFPPESVEFVTPYYRRVFEGETLNFELEVAGRWFLINAAPLGDADGRINSIIALAQDITERRRVEDALRESEAKLRRAHDELEVRVKQRTQVLLEITESLEREVKERKVAENQVKELLRRLVTVQEEERRRIAREIHDQVGQEMTALRLKLESIEPESNRQSSSIREQIAQARLMAERIDSNIDYFAWELRPAVLDELGIKTALGNLVRDWSEHTGINAEFQAVTAVDRHFREEVEINLYRIVQEALNNVRKHAGAQSVNVFISQRDGFLGIVIEDDGVGYAHETASSSNNQSGMGLINMRERAVLAGGRLEVESEFGKGTTVFVRVPVKLENQ
jgi:PAS domain S-box-containing protein